MRIVDQESLAETLDRINDAIFFGREIPKPKKIEAARWIASRQGLGRSYAGMPAPTDKDFTNSATLFTGEKLKTRASTAHILGEEACRALVLLDVRESAVKDALRLATEGMKSRLGPADCAPGMYCCGTCSVAYWRHLMVGGLANQEKALVAGMKDLKRHRDGKGRWRRFPFYYTLLALAELDLKGAVDEMRYAVPSCERALKARGMTNRYGVRKVELLERVLKRA
jgi:hypothetical protein